MKLVISIYFQISFFGLIKGTIDYAKMVFIVFVWPFYIQHCIISIGLKCIKKTFFILSNSFGLTSVYIIDKKWFSLVIRITCIYFSYF
jgi:hypothetical protein